MGRLFRPQMTIGSTYNNKNNNFHFVRFVLAILVIYCHACVLLFSDYKGDVLAQITNNKIDIGALAVHCFFVVSGFLIAQSALHSSSAFDYIIKRVLRIVPAFLVSLVCVAFIVGPIVTSLSLRDYFSPAGADPYKFVYKNIIFGIDGNVWGFKDVFSGNPHENSVNGSMWTLAHEFAMYLVLGGLIVLGVIKRRVVLLLLFAVFVVALIAYNENHFILINKPVVQWWVLNVWNYSKFITEGFFFICGSLIYMYRDKVPFNKKVFLFAVVGAILFFIFDHIKLGLFVFLPYTVIYICVSGRYATFRKYGDYSYGLYIFSFPIQQTILYVNKDWSLLQYSILSLFFSLVAAFISWHIIEKPTLGLKNRFRMQIIRNETRKKNIVSEQ